MNLKDILTSKQKRNLRRHYNYYYTHLKVRGYFPLSFHSWLKSYVDNNLFNILISMANEV